VARDPLASDIARMLTERGFVASARPLPPWPSKSPNASEIVLVDLAGQPRPIAAVEWERVTSCGPPGMYGGSWTVEYRYRDQWFMPMPDIAAGLVDLAQKWSREPEAIGLLDVVLALMDALPPVDGGWRPRVSGHEAWLGVERGALRWPEFLRIEVRREVLLAHVPPPPGIESRWFPRTRAELAGDVPGIVACVAEQLRWCERFVEERRALEKFAALVCAELVRAHPPPSGQWSMPAPPVSQFTVRDRPGASIQWNGGTIHVTTDDAGRAVVDGVTYPDDTTMTALAEAIAKRVR
jgi:hypothetical protein